MRHTEQASSGIFRMGKVRPRSEGELVWGAWLLETPGPQSDFSFFPFSNASCYSLPKVNRGSSNCVKT